MRIGYLSGGDPEEANLGQFRTGLARIGWVQGRDFTIVGRFAMLDYARFPALTAELVADRIDVLVTSGIATRVIPAAEKAVPVVFAFSGDPVAGGLVASLARPGGNATGISMLHFELVGKRLELLREAAPAARRTLVLQSPTHPGEQQERHLTAVAADRLGIALMLRPVSDRAQVLAALAEGDAAGCDSLLCFSDAVTLAHRDVIAAHARARRLPSIFGRREFCDAGGLLSYGPSVAAIFARLAVFVERIAAGTRPGDLPVELPTEIETVVNAKTAQAIGATLPPSLLLRVDAVVE